MIRDAAYWRRYEQSPKRKAWVAQYRAEGKRQAAHDRYYDSDKRKANTAKAAAKRAAARAAYRAENPLPPPAGYFETQRKYNRSPKKHAAWIRNRYKLTPEMVERLGAQTVCAICGSNEKKLCVDHKHEPHQVRDRLCRYCNIMVGVLEHANFQKAVEYLAHWDAMLPD